jgi:cation:H+ antiporter
MVFVYMVLGLVILLLAGDALVRGTVNLSLRLGVPALIVSLTIVAFGTSAPELLIAVKAVLEDAPGIALGNVVGSNTANILLVLGVPAIISGLATSQCDSRRTYLVMLAVSAMFIALCFAGPIIWWHGVLLLGVLALFLGDAFLSARRHRAGEAAGPEAEDELIDEADPAMPGWRIALYIVLGLAGLPLGADMLVDGAVVLAQRFGVSDTIIGLTLIALGTSLPELATTVMAAFRRQAEVALGNVIGSNIFNLLAIIGVASFFGPIAVEREFLVFDLWVMLGASLALAPFVLFRRDMTRLWGGILTALYVIYVVVLLEFGG